MTKWKIGVLGAGTWGMALARMLCVNGNDVTVWSALEQEIDALSANRTHPNLPGMQIPAEMAFTKSIQEVCTGKDVLLFAVPSVFVRSTAAKARPFVPEGQVIVDVAKGIEPGTLLTMTEVLADELGKEGGPQKVRLVALSGPYARRRSGAGSADHHRVCQPGRGGSPLCAGSVYHRLYAGIHQRRCEGCGAERRTRTSLPWAWASPLAWAMGITLVLP